MGWPCPHIMAWDDQYGRDYTLHFKSCWFTTSVRKVYEQTIPCFLENNLEYSEACIPPPIAVKRGRHRVVRIRSGGGQRRVADLGEDETVTNTGDLLITYPVDDEVILPMPRERNNRQYVGRNKRTKGTSTVRCGKCGVQGHNKRTCKLGTANQERISSTVDDILQEILNLPIEEVSVQEETDPKAVYDSAEDEEDNLAVWMDEEVGQFADEVQHYVNIATQVHEERIRDELDSVGQW
ncbi:unnamed protein product [Calypogeia fissa]